MALAFYVPDQARLMQRARYLQMRQNLRRFYWYYLIALFYLHHIGQNVSTIDLQRCDFNSRQRLKSLLKNFVLNS